MFALLSVKGNGEKGTKPLPLITNTGVFTFSHRSTQMPVCMCACAHMCSHTCMLTHLCAHPWCAHMHMYGLRRPERVLFSASPAPSPCLGPGRCSLAIGCVGEWSTWPLMQAERVGRIAGAEGGLPGARVCAAPECLLCPRLSHNPPARMWVDVTVPRRQGDSEIPQPWSLGREMLCCPPPCAGTAPTCPCPAPPHALHNPGYGLLGWAGCGP